MTSLLEQIKLRQRTSYLFFFSFSLLRRNKFLWEIKLLRNFSNNNIKVWLDEKFARKCLHVHLQIKNHQRFLWTLISLTRLLNRIGWSQSMQCLSEEKFGGVLAICNLQTKLLCTILTLEANYKWLLIALQFRESLASEHLHAICVYWETYFQLTTFIQRNVQCILDFIMFKL